MSTVSPTVAHIPLSGNTLERFAMLGAIAGDIVGSRYEPHPIKTTDFALFGPGCCFTDDTVMTVAIAEAILAGEPFDFVTPLKAWYRRHPHVGYGKTFARWAAHPTDRDPYQSWGNGSAMRVSPVVWAFDNLDDVKRVAAASAAVTHDHPEGIAGAQAVAACGFLARTGASKTQIRACATAFYGARMDRTLAQIRPGYTFDVSCIGSVPEAIIAFLESDSFEGALRNAVSLGGDSDTQACIAGTIAEGFYGGVPELIRIETLRRLDDELQVAVLTAIERWCRPSRPTPA
jgi:ADP-ribosylglycohydrolase